MLADEEEEAEELVQKKKESFELTDEILLMGAAILAGLLLLCFVIWKSLRVRARRAHKLKKIMGEVALGASEGAGEPQEHPISIKIIPTIWMWKWYKLKHRV